MAYRYLTFAGFRAELASRLGDSGNVYWLDDELKRYTWEALRTFQAMTGYWRTRVTFNATASEPFYDLTSASSTGSGASSPSSALGLNALDQDVFAELQYQLVETAGAQATGNSWTGTEMFSLALVQGAIERRRNQFLSDTGCLLSRQSFPVSQPSGRLGLPDSVLDVRRLAWVDAASGSVTPLWPTDEQAEASFSRSWPSTPGLPRDYSILGSPPLTVQVFPPSSTAGSLDALLINEPGDLNVAVGVLLGVPDNFSWAVKWGALAELLGADGEARDLTRAAYCEARYQEAVGICRSFPVVVQAMLGGVAVQVEAVADFDAFRASWQGAAPGPPTAVATAGNFLALAPVPDSVAPYAVTLDVVSNAPLPSADSQFIQLGREDLDALLDAAQHIASFKLGGSDFTDTTVVDQRFRSRAAVYNDRLAATAPYLSAIQGTSTREEKLRPRRASDTSVTA